jgi:hypothetical protein
VACVAAKFSAPLFASHKISEVSKMPALQTQTEIGVRLSSGEGNTFFDVVLMQDCPTVRDVARVIALRLDHGDVSPTGRLNPFLPVPGSRFRWILTDRKGIHSLLQVERVHYYNHLEASQIPSEYADYRCQSKSVGCLVCSEMGQPN